MRHPAAGHGDHPWQHPLAGLNLSRIRRQPAEISLERAFELVGVAPQNSWRERNAIHPRKFCDVK
jgi:hypothetical protein